MQLDVCFMNPLPVPGRVRLKPDKAAVEGLTQWTSSQWLKIGDVVRMEVEGIGYLENRVVPEPPGTMEFIG